MHRITVLLLPLSLLLSAAAQPQATRCSPQDATNADAIVDHLDTWSKMAAAIRRYGGCDEGSIAEGNSEAVARLLVDHWNTLPQMVYLARSNPQLRDFVLKHVDSTLDTHDLERVQWLASHACPPGAAAMCGDLGRAAAMALRQQSR